MKKKYDVVIIGSGLGGLVAALVLAKEGRKVCVLEKNNQYGGNLQTFVRNKTILDTGVHYIGGLAPEQNLYRYFKYLNIYDDLQIERLDADGYDRISFDDHEIDYPHAQGYENFIQQLLAIFPEEEKALHIYTEMLQKVCDSFPLYALKDGSGYDESVLSINTKDFLDRITTNDALKSVLFGTSFLYAGDAATTPLYVHALSVCSYISSAWRCVKGGSQISKALVRQLRKHGADLFKHQEVDALISEENRIIACKTQTSVYEADIFISNIDIKQTIRLAGASLFGKPYANRVNQLDVVPSVFSVHLVLKPEYIPYFDYNIYHYKNPDDVWTSHHPLDKNWPRMYVITTSPKQSGQTYCDSITIMTYMNFNEVKQWENTQNTVANPADRGEEYDHFKKQQAQKLINEVARKIPNLKEAIAEIYTSTPLSYRDYIGNEKGNLYGFVKDSSQPMKSFISPKTKIKNLFLTGQNVNMHGILGVTISGFVAAAQIVGRDALLDKVRKATSG